MIKFKQRKQTQVANFAKGSMRHITISIGHFSDISIDYNKLFIALRRQRKGNFTGLQRGGSKFLQNKVLSMTVSNETA